MEQHGVDEQGQITLESVRGWYQAKLDRVHPNTPEEMVRPRLRRVGVLLEEIDRLNEVLATSPLVAERNRWRRRYNEVVAQLRGSAQLDNDEVQELYETLPKVVAERDTAMAAVDRLTAERDAIHNDRANEIAKGESAWANGFESGVAEGRKQASTSRMLEGQVLDATADPRLDEIMEQGRSIGAQLGRVAAQHQAVSAALVEGFVMGAMPGSQRAAQIRERLSVVLEETAASWISDEAHEADVDAGQRTWEESGAEVGRMMDEAMRELDDDGCATTLGGRNVADREHIEDLNRRGVVSDDELTEWRERNPGVQFVNEPGFPSPVEAPAPPFLNVAEMIGTIGMQAVALPPGLRKMFEEAADQAQVHAVEAAIHGETTLRVPPAAVPMDGMPSPVAPTVQVTSVPEAEPGTAAHLLELYTALPASALDAEPGEWPLMTVDGMECRDVAGEWEYPEDGGRPVLVDVTWDEVAPDRSEGQRVIRRPDEPVAIVLPLIAPPVEVPEAEPSFSDLVEPWAEGSTPVFTSESFVRTAELCPNLPQSTPWNQAVAILERGFAAVREGWERGWAKRPADSNPMSRVDHHTSTGPYDGATVLTHQRPGELGGANVYLHGVETPRVKPRYVYVASSWRNEMQPAVVAVLRAAGIDCYDFRDPHGDGAGGFSWKDVRDEPNDPLCRCGHFQREHAVVAGFPANCGAMNGNLGPCNCLEFTVQIAAKGSDLVPADEYLRMIEHPAALDGFAKDLAAMERADVFVLVLPCGKSAHLEAGWAMGTGKRVVILLEDPVEPELMYRTTYESGGTIVTDTMALLAALGVED